MDQPIHRTETFRHEGFIAAEQYTYADFVELKSESAVKAAGKYKTQGKLYQVRDGDILFFKFNVTTTKKK